MRAEDDIEAETSARGGEELLRARLAGQRPLEGRRVELVGVQRAWDLQPREEGRARRLRPKIDESDEDLSVAHQLDRTTAEVADVGRHGEVGGVQHRVRVLECG